MRYFFLLMITAAIYNSSAAQGCVAIRSNGGTCTLMEPHNNAKQNGWSFGLNSRYFKSFRHFSDKIEQKQRVEQGTEVINHSYGIETSVTRTVNDRWSFAFFVPIIANTRSSLYEHSGKSRYKTHSFGMGDARVAAYRWLLNPSSHSKANVQIGLGIKLPTGDYRYQDYFYKNDSTKILGPVDQSIQLGDGGTGFTLEANTFYHLAKQVSIYANAFYLLNPRAQNGVSTARGGIPSATNISYGLDVMSVPDQYMVRAGANYTLNKLSFSAGMRMECVPVYDLLGGSNGFRRPGYVVSVEPVVAYKASKTQFYISVPYAVERARKQSVPDKIRTTKTGTPFTGDAAFADYSINFGIAFSLK